jgi:hypothetical protein
MALRLQQGSLSFAKLVVDQGQQGGHRRILLFTLGLQN